MKNVELLQAIQEMMPEIIEIRRDIHRHPEIGRKEFRTTALIKEKLQEYGVDEIKSLMPTGAVALIRGEREADVCISSQNRYRRSSRTGGDGTSLQQSGAGHDARLRSRYACVHDAGSSQVFMF